MAGSSPKLMEAENPLPAMLAISTVNPVYSTRTDAAYHRTMFEPAARAGQVLFMDMDPGLAFFSYLWPEQPILHCADFTSDMWTQRGPLLWIGDVCCTPDISGVRLGKAIRKAVADTALASPGDRVIYWRPNRLGWFQVPG